MPGFIVHAERKGLNGSFRVLACVLPENEPDVICVRMDPANWIQR